MLMILNCVPVHMWISYLNKPILVALKDLTLETTGLEILNMWSTIFDEDMEKLGQIIYYHLLNH